jgi:prolyl oligopeptidase
MRQPIEPPPVTPAEPVTEILHGVPVTDPFRWLEDPSSPRTHKWIEQQRRYARTYLDGIPGRDRVRERIREFLAVETYYSPQKVAGRYFFRKRLPHQEQPCIYLREGADGTDELLLDPADRKTGKHTAIRPLHVSPDGRLLLYEVKDGGERSGTFELMEIDGRRILPETLPRGYLRGFAFAPDSKSFYYVLDALDAKRPFYRAAYQHVLGTAFSNDREVFDAGEDERLRLHLVSDAKRLGFVVYRFLERMRTDFYLKPFESQGAPNVVLVDADYTFNPRLVPSRILALTDRHAPNRRIVELRMRSGQDPEWIDVVPESEDRIDRWVIASDRLFVSYIRRTSSHVHIFDLSGATAGELPVHDGQTVSLIPCAADSDELLFEAESFTEPISIFRYCRSTRMCELWGKKRTPFESSNYTYVRVCYASKDGTEIPMFLMGRRDRLDGGTHPTVMTSYGGYGVSMTPRFSVFVAFLVERGCLFALPNIRGGSEFGVEWHNAAKRRNRQTAYDDFLSAAEWLIRTERTRADQLAIFGGSNSGLLVGAAVTQRPELFRAVVCMVPILDMLRYHLFDGAHIWREEFGTADDSVDFAALASYSPYHQVRDGVPYPATMIVSGDADGTCNPSHARKMTARLQTANTSPLPIVLDWNPFRGHSPMLPLGDRIEALTDRMAFLCDQLRLSV